jgi:hypothetical protein
MLGLAFVACEAVKSEREAVREGGAKRPSTRVSNTISID